MLFRLKREDLGFNGLWVSELPGDGGVDWGYNTKKERAMGLTSAECARYIEDCYYVNGHVYIEPYNEE